jgi:hypothetical protein
MVRSLLSALLALLLAPGALSQPAQQGSVKTTVEVTILTLDVLAIDSKERPVYDLVADDFEVRVAGKAQPIEGFEAPARPGAGPKGGDSEVERIAGTTLPIKPGGPPPLHVLLYIDMEQLNGSGVVEAARAGLEYAQAPEGGPRLSLVTYFGAASTRLWDETSIDHMTSELEAVASEPAAMAGGSSVSSRDSMGRVTSGASVRNWDQRQRIETALIEDIILAEATPRNQNAIIAAYGAFAEYLRDERIRVRDSIRELRAVCERFALLGDRRQAILFSQGYERIPGMNAVQFLAAARDANGKAGSSIGTTRARGDVMGSMPSGASGRLIFNNSAISDLDDLETWLAASGVTLHFIDTSRGADMTTAEHGAVASTRDRRSDLRNVQDGGTRLADATGGLVRLLPSDLGKTLGGVATAATQTYRIAVRLSNVDYNKPYRISVAVKKNGVKARARRTFVADNPGAQRARNVNQVDQALQSVGRARAEEKLPGAVRMTAKPISVTAEWKGKKGPNPSDPNQPFYKLDVTIPYDDLRFVPEEDSMVSSLKVVIKATSTETKWSDAFTEDLFLSFTGAEFSAVTGKPYVKSITLPMPPGKIDLTVSVNDVLENSFGATQLRVVAEK